MNDTRKKIWTHPKVLEDAWKNANIQKSKKDARKVTCPHSDEDQPDDIYDSQTGFISVTNDWWRRYLSKIDLETIMPSNKLRTMFSILRLCEEKGEKCLIFSAFVAVLNVVEYFFKKITESDPEILQNIHVPSSKPITNKWINGQDYYRLDGKTPKNIRHEMIKRFNSESNRRARVFLISAKAGGQGINLVGANRVIILDTSWNPSNDQQNIFRIFRLGQKKNCYIYRLIAMGTMEEKVYSRSVTKQAMSFRVVDEQQIDRHYNMAELAELYTLTIPQRNERTVPVLPKDTILAYLLRQSDLVYKYHEHDSLLENKIEQELSEEEKADAWETYEKELQLNLGQEEGFDTDRIQNISLSKIGPYSGLSVPNLDMNTLLNYSLQSASIIPQYGFNMSPNYLDTLNLYQKYSLQYSDINSFINDSSHGSLHLNATGTSNCLPRRASIVPNILSPKSTTSDFALFDPQKQCRLNPQLQQTFCKDVTTTNKHSIANSSLAEYQHLLENPLPNILNFSSHGYTSTTTGVPHNNHNKSIFPVQNALSYPGISGITPEDFENIFVKKSKITSYDDSKRIAVAHENNIGQTGDVVDLTTSKPMSIKNDSSLKMNIENMSVQPHKVAPYSFDQKIHKKLKISKTDTFGYGKTKLSSLMTKNCIQNNGEMQIIPTTSPPGSSITKQLNEMSPSISLTALSTLKEKITQEKLTTDYPKTTISNLSRNPNIYNAPIDIKALEKTENSIKNAAADKIKSDQTLAAGDSNTNKRTTKSIANLTSSNSITQTLAVKKIIACDPMNNHTIQASPLNNAIGIRPVIHSTTNVPIIEEFTKNNKMSEANFKSKRTQLSIRKRQAENSKQSNNTKRTKH